METEMFTALVTLTDPGSHRRHYNEAYAPATTI